MTTYIVDIDSNYRNINEYQYQTDFSVSFKAEDYQTEQLLGLPYSFSSGNNSNTYNNFFNLSSIDPNFNNADLQVINGNVQEINLYNGSYYISGIAFDTTTSVVSSTGFSINFQNQSLVSLTGINNVSPYLCKLKQTISGYSFDWCIYSVGTDTVGTVSSFPMSIRCKNTISSRGGIFWYWDFMYDNFKVYKINKVLDQSTLFSISNFSSTKNPVCNAIFSFNEAGSIYLVNNRPWGYHILQSDFKLVPYNENGQLNLSLDQAENLYISTNLDGTDSYASEPIVVGPVRADVLTTFLSTDYVYRYVTGTTGSYTGPGTLTEYFVSYSNPSRYTYFQTSFRILSCSPTSLYGASLIYENVLVPYLTPSVTFCSSQSYFTDILGRFFFMFYPSDNVQNIYTFNSSNKYRGYLLEIDLIGKSISLAAQTPVLFNCCNVIGTTIGNNIYFPGRDNFSNIYMYSYNITTSAFTGTSISIATTATLEATVSSIQLDVDNIRVISPDTNYLLSGNINTYSKVNTLWILNYNISTNTLTTQNSSLKVYSYIILQKIIKYKGTRLLYFVLYSNPSLIEIFDVTSSSPFLINSLNIKAINMEVYTNTDKLGNLHYLINLSQGGNGMSIYCFDDIYNIFLITSNISLNKYQSLIGQSLVYSSCKVSPYGYSYYFPNIVAEYFRFRWSDFPSLTFTSTHYFFNLSSTSSIGTSFNVMKTFSMNSQNYIVCGSRTTLSIYSFPNLTSTQLINSLSLPISLSSVPIYFRVLPIDDTYMYILIGNNLEIQLHICSLNSITPMITIVPVSSSTIRGAVLYYTEFASVPGYYMIITQQNGFHRKFKLVGSSSSLVASDTTSILAGRIIFNTDIIYYSTQNVYRLGIITNIIPLSINSAGTYYQLTVTNETDLIFSFSSPALLSQQTILPSNIYTNALNFTGKYKFINSFLIQNGQSFLASTIANWNFEPSSTSAIPPTNNNSFIYNTNQNFDYNTGNNFYTLQSVQWYDFLFNKNYIAMSSNGKTGANDSITIIEANNPKNVSIEQGTLTINVPGTVVSLQIVQEGLNTTLVALLNNIFATGPSSLWLYDVSNVDNAVKYQSITSLTKTYTNLNTICGAGIVHNISTFGEPIWLSLFGGGISMDGYSSNNIFITGMTIDDLNHLYIVGNWSNKVELYSSSSASGTQLNSYPSNEFKTNTNYNQGIISKLNTNGLFEWSQVLVGSGDVYTGNIVYSTVLNRFSIPFYFSAINLNLFSKQLSIVNPTGTFSFTTLGDPIKFFFNTSSTNSVILTNDEEGNYVWRNVFFSNTDPNSLINFKYIDIDETNNNNIRYVVCGISNSLDINGSDSQNNLIQNLYPPINKLTQVTSLLYQFNSTGGYENSSFQLAPQNSIVINNYVKSFATENTIFTFNQVIPPDNNETINFFNQDSSLSERLSCVPFISNVFLSQYVYDSTFIDSNNQIYSKVVLYNFSGPTGNLTGTFQNNQLFILGTQTDSSLNRNFSIRRGIYDFTSQELILYLNKKININELDRRFKTINNIPNSQYNYISNLSQSPLYDIAIMASSGVSGNSITFSTFYNHPPGSIDIAKDYYIAIPQIPTGSSTGTYTDIIPISSFSYNSTTQQYTATIQDILQLNVPSPSGPMYGPYFYVCQKNYTAFYTLQWYPGAYTYSQTYLVGLYDLIIPNRPIISSRYNGRRFITDFPYLYIVIYNTTKENILNTSIVNSIYDNNINSPALALFQIPTTNFNFNIEGNYISATSSSTPKIQFLPGYYYLHIRLTDDQGNTIIFDPSPYKESDSIFTDTVPDSLLNITCRLAFKKF